MTFGRKPETAALRQCVVDRWNAGNPGRGPGVTYADIAVEMGLTRGAVGRLLTEARAFGLRVRRRMRTSVAGKRAARSLRQSIGEEAFLRKMAGVRAARKSRCRSELTP